jgi:AraC family transcriptional regulator
MSSPVRDGYAELIITPDVQLLSELAHVNGTPLFMDPLFRRRARRVEPRVQSFRARFLHWARTARHRDVLEAEELVLALLRATLQSTETRQGPNGISTSRLIRRTKEYLEGNLSNRILLSDVARETGASPAYLTDLFRRVEGVSLH